MDIKTLDGTVQLVLNVEVLEMLLSKFPHIQVFTLPYAEDDLPAYGLAPKQD